MARRPFDDVTEVVLRDGTTLSVRRAKPEDRLRVEDYLIGLSPETRRLRFGSASVAVSEVAARAVEESEGHLALLALRGGPEGEVIGGAQYFRTGPGRAEVSLSVADALQGHGLGSILIGRLAAAADAAGVGTLVASVLPDNHRMIEVFRESGFAPTVRAFPGAIEVEFPSHLTDDAERVFEHRATEAARNAVRAFLEPRSVAVVGASRDPASIGGRLLRNLLVGGFTGVVYPVNPNARSVQGVETFASILDVPGDVDVAYICVPSSLVAAVASDCAKKGVAGLVVISSGFSEIGGDGPERQRELLAICREAGMRLIGPNCMGILNTAEDVRLDGTFASVKPIPGRVGFLSQSGALGIAVMAHTAELGIGLSSFVSVGNRADISSNDLLAYWETDDETDVVLLYLESFGNPRRFAELSRRIAERKPIVAMKSGRTPAGARATSSHTGSILRSSEAAVDALFRQNGIIRTDTLSEMLDIAELLTNQPVPKGHRVAIITNAGGLGILCADVAVTQGLRVEPFSDATTAALTRALPAEASAANPVDMIASASGADYAKVIRRIARSGEVDAIIVIFIPPLETQVADVTEHVAAAVREVRDTVTVVTSFMSADPGRRSGRRIGPDVPSFPYPEQAAIALSRATELGAWRRRERGTVPAFDDLRSDEAAAIIAAALDRGGDGWLTAEECRRVLSCYGIETARAELASSPKEAAEAAAQIGDRVALKALGPLHKTEVGAVRLRLSPANVEREAAEMQRRLTDARMPFERFQVQEMVSDGVEMLVGVAPDPTFGPVVLCGAGGTAAELLRDVAIRIPPIADTDAKDMVRSLATHPLLFGYRGAPAVNVFDLEQLIMRVGALVEHHPSIAELDCNPVTVTPRRAVVLDTRIRAEAAPEPVQLGAPL
jgi:acetyl coenzyme A synthetase (ADP forming)-like protein